VATFNILHGRSPADGRVDLDRYAAAIRRLDVDVLALQEVDRAQPRSHRADLTAVAAEAMGAEHHRFVAALHGEPGMWVAATGEAQPEHAAYGIALLSRASVLRWRVVALPTLTHPTPVLFPGRRWPVLVEDEPRAAVAAEIVTGAGPLTVVCTHLTFVPGWNVHQLRHLRRRLDDVTGPLVVLGDLNIPGRRAAQAAGMRPLATAATFPVARPVKQLDHILAAGDVHAVGAGEALDLGLSDHRALAVELDR
jgi:endonuclease/exonuclease/phosphatase family metal-dependent hydrolase